jgi:TP901 family phage tail tape measure protein
MSVRLLADTRRFSSGMLKAQTEMGFTIRNAGRLEEKIGKVGLTAGVAARAFHVASGGIRAVSIAAVAGTAAILGFGAATSKVARKYEVQWKKVVAISQASSKDLASLEQTTFENARKFGQSPTELQRGNEEALRTGLSASAAEAIQDDSIKLATIEMQDLSKITKLATDVMINFGMHTKAVMGPEGQMDTEAYRIGFQKTAAILATTSATANTNAVALAEGLKMVGSTANTAKAPLSQISAAMGLLGNVGIQGEMAGTALRNIFTKASGPSKQVKKLLKEANVELAKMGTSKGLIEQVRALEKANLSQANINDIFGLRAGPAMLALLQQGADKLEYYSNFLEESAELSAFFNDMQATTAMKVNQVKAVLETAAITVGTVFNVAIGEASRRFLEWWDSIDNAQQKLYDFAARGLGSMLTGLENFLRSMPPVLDILGTFADAIRLVGKTGRFVFELLARNVAIMAKAVMTWVSPLTTAFSTLFRILKEEAAKLAGLWDIITDPSKSFGDKMAAMSDALSNSASNAWKIAKEEAVAAWEDAKSNMVGIVNDLNAQKDLAESFFSAITDKDELLKISNIFNKIGEGAILAADEVADFNKAVQTLLNDPKLKENTAFMDKLEEFRRKMEEFKSKYTGENHFDMDKGGKQKENAKKQLGYLNKYRVMAGQIIARQDDGLLKEKAWLEYAAEREDILRRNLSVTDQEILLDAAHEDYLRRLADIEGQREAIKARNAKFAEDEWQAHHKLFVEKQRMMMLDRVGGLTAGISAFGGAGVASSLQTELADIQANYDRQRLEGLDKINDAITRENEQIIRQIELYEKLADTIGSEVPNMIEGLSGLTAETFKGKEGTQAMVNAMGSLVSLGSAAFAAMGMGAKQQRTAQMALNLAMAAFAVGMGFVSVATPGMQAQAPGYFAAAAAFGAKAALGGAGNRAAKRLAPTRSAPEKREEAETVKRGVVDALHEAGLYQPWERLTINTFGTTPVGYGGGDNLRTARSVAYHNQNNRRSRG